MKMLSELLDIMFITQADETLSLFPQFFNFSRTKLYQNNIRWTADYKTEKRRKLNEFLMQIANLQPLQTFLFEFDPN